jgi:hypothetical protein
VRCRLHDALREVSNVTGGASCRYPGVRSTLGLLVVFAALACSPRTQSRGAAEAGPDAGRQATQDVTPDPATPAAIGEATMLEDGTLVLDLVAAAGDTRGHGRITYRPTDPQYAEVLEHLGGLRPGERKLVPPWPDEIDDARVQGSVEEYLAHKDGWSSVEHSVDIAGTDAQGRIAVTVMRRVAPSAAGTAEGRLLALRLDPNSYAVVDELTPENGPAARSGDAAPDAAAGEPEQEVQATGGGEARGRIWRVGHFVCVHEADTVQVSQGSPAVPVGSCRNWPGDSAVDFAQRKALCGPCGFWLDADQSRHERAATADACCYLVSSPPPPPPPPPIPPHE